MGYSPLTKMIISAVAVTAIAVPVLRSQIEDQPATSDVAVGTPTQTAGSPIDLTALRVDAERPTSLADDTDNAKAIGEILTNAQPLGGMVETNPTNTIQKPMAPDNTDTIAGVLTNAQPLGGMVETNPTTNSGKTNSSNTMTATNSGKTNSSNTMTATNSGKTNSGNTMTTTRPVDNIITKPTNNTGNTGNTMTTTKPVKTSPQVTLGSTTIPSKATQPAAPVHQPVAAPKSPLLCLLLFLLGRPC